MVPLPLFKLATLFVRHVSKYGANRIKAQAHEHPRFRAFAVRYGQAIHQLNMRMSVAAIRNATDEARTREKAGAPTVKTKEQAARGDEAAAKRAAAKDQPHPPHGTATPAGSIWKRKFRPLPEAKAADLFADVVGDAFILAVATVLILYEYWRASKKPDPNADKIAALNRQIDELRSRDEELRKQEELQRHRFDVLEAALREVKDPKTKRPLLDQLQPPSSAG